MIEPVSKNILYGNVMDNKLAYSTWDKKVIVEDVEKKDTLFVQKTKDLCYITPKIKVSYVFFKSADDEFMCFNTKNNELQWKITTDNIPNDFVILNNSIGLLNIKQKGIVGVNIENGKKEYLLKYEYDKECLSPDVSPYPIVYDEQSFYVSNWQCKTIRAFNINNGQELWNKNLSRGASKSILYKDKIFVGIDEYYKGGKIYILDSNNGNVLSIQSDVHILLRRTPVLWKDKVIFYDYYKNSLEEYDFETNKINTIKQYHKSHGKTEKRSNEITGQLFLVNDFLYYQNNQFNIMKFDLNAKKETIIAKSNKGGISTVYIDENGKESIFY